MTLVLLTFAACSNDPFAPPETMTDRYTGFPVLQAVSVECSAADIGFVVETRTKGWTERGIVQIWPATGDPDADLATLGGEASSEFDIETTEFTEDETCDIREATQVEEDLPCTGTFAESFTALVRVTFEKGCAGVVPVGRYADAILSGEVVITDETPIDDVCPAPFSQGWSQTAPAPPAMDAEVLPSVPRCDEAL